MKVLVVLVVVVGVLWLVARRLPRRPASGVGWAQTALARRGPRTVVTIVLVVLCLYVLSRLGVPVVPLTGQLGVALGRAIGGLLEELGQLHRV